MFFEGRALLKKILSFLCIRVIFIDKIFKSKNKRKLVVLYYHRLLPKGKKLGGRHSGMFVDEEQFDLQMRYISEHFRPVSLDGLNAFIDQKEDLPDYPVLVAFDDGYRDNYLQAFPILKKHRINAVIFVTSGFVNRVAVPWKDRVQRLSEVAGYNMLTERLKAKMSSQYPGAAGLGSGAINILSGLRNEEKDHVLTEMEQQFDVRATSYQALFCSWDELREMKVQGISIEPHTVTHPILSSIDDEQIEKEIYLSKNEVEKEIGCQVTSFAYPKGRLEDFNEKAVQCLKKHGFNCSFTTDHGLNEIGLLKDDELFYIKRCGIDYHDTLDTFKLKISGAWKLFDRS